MTDRAKTKGADAAQPTRRPRPADATTLTCPKCQGVMRAYSRGGLVVELCEDCRGIFLDKGELERLIEAEGGGWSGIVSTAVDPRG